MTKRATPRTIAVVSRFKDNSWHASISAARWIIAGGATSSTKITLCDNADPLAFFEGSLGVRRIRVMV